MPDDACPGGTVQIAPAEDEQPAQCQPCTAGTYCAGGTSQSHPCSGSSWDHDEDPATDCVDRTLCTAGEYLMSDGDAVTDRECANCEPGFFSLETNAELCRAFTQCALGTFIETPGTLTGDRACASCPAGTFSDAIDQDACEAWADCQPGEFVATPGSANADRECEPCAEDEFSATVNAAACVADGECAPGTYQVEAGTLDSPALCEACVAGEYCAGADVPADPCEDFTWDHDADPATPCVDHGQCLAGTYIDSLGDALSDQVCVACQAGSFSADVDLMACQPWRQCAAGTFVQTMGSASSDVACAGCSSGTFSAAANASSCSTWVDCQPGEYVLAAGSATTDRECEDCAAGQYSSGINAGACVDVGQCEPGTVETQPATPTSPAVCSPCSAGNYCAGGQANEVACSASQWDDDLDPATPCVSKTTCVAGQYVQSAGNPTTDRSCSPCAASQFSTTENAGSCTAWQTCAAGTYVAAAGSSTTNRTCSACAAGTFSSTTNSASCSAWSDCYAPFSRQTSAPSASMDRQCSNCTAPAVTAADNTTSCSNPLTFQMSDTEVVLEGEHFASTSAVGTGNSWSVTSISGGVASGDEVVALGPVNPTDFWTDVATVPTVAPRLVYSVNLTQSATYYVFIRGNDPDGVSGGDSCWAGFDNVPMSMTYFDFDDDAATWSWKSQSISLGAGVHTFHIWGREDGLRVDKIVINTTGTAPTGLGPAESARN